MQAEDHLLPESLKVFLPGLKSLLQFMSNQLEKDLELLSDKGRDRMFHSASGMLEKLNILLNLCESPAEADAQVCALCIACSGDSSTKSLCPTPSISCSLVFAYEQVYHITMFSLIS